MRSEQLMRVLAGWLALAAPAWAAVPGGIEVIDLPADARGAWYDGKPVFVLVAPRPVAVVGVPLEAEPGRHHLEIEHADGTRARLSFDVTPKSYPEQRITIANPKMVNPSAEDLARIEREAALMTRVFERFTSARTSPFPMLRPAPGPRSSAFGLRRFFNGEPRNPHSGLDIVAATGDPVAAPAAGTVAAVGDFYFNGNTVMIDHGGGVISMACHLSAVDVKEGAAVERGQIVGKVGATGRATGPHLHWSLSLNGVRVDPEQALVLRVDRTGAAPASR